MSEEPPFVVEPGVKMPTFLWEKYPFSTMEVGSSFKLKPNSHGKVRAAASHHGKRFGKKFSIRCTDPVKRTYRCWRLA